ncbi:MAG: hypothetical protein Q4C48_04340 [Lachnospiraceae bacterium]|nr:hypothetical protein [Lachnospiraceae bacterium]
MKDKKKNGGLATMEIVVAAVILAVVIIGVIVVIKLVFGGSDEDGKQTAQQQAESVYDMLKTNVAKADLEIVFNAQENGGTLRLIGRSSYQVYKYNSTSKTLFYEEKAYTNATTDEEKIASAKSTPLDETVATVLCQDAQVMTFFVLVPDLTQADATLSVQLRVEDEDSYYQDYKIPVSQDLIALKNGTWTPAEPTDPEATPGTDPEPTPAVDDPSPTPAPTNTPKPTEGPMRSSKLLGTSSLEATYDQMAEYLETYGEDAQLVLTLKFRLGSAKQGWGVGGLAIDSDSCEGDVFEYFIDHDPEANEIFTAVYDLKDIVAEMKDRDAENLKTVFYNGFTVTKIEIQYD